MSRARRVWPVIVTAALGIAVLCALGAWQVQRLGVKQALLAEIDRRAVAAPIDLSEAIERAEAGEAIEFLKVSATGRFLHDAEKLMIGTFDGGSGWEVVTPLVTTGDTLVLVDRGIVPGSLREAASRAEGNPAGEVTVTGILRARDGKRGFFSIDNDAAANMWFWWDVPAMLAATPLPEGAMAVPFVLQRLPVAGEKGFPRPQAADAGLVNNHLQYAITWFSLALVLLVIAVIYVRGQMKKTAA